MAHLLPVTHGSGSVTYVNLDVVRSIEGAAQGPGSHIVFMNGDRITVQESPKWIYERSLSRGS